MAVKSERLGLEIVRALGLDAGNVTGITIACNAGGLAEITIRRIITDDETSKLLDVINRFALVGREE